MKKMNKYPISKKVIISITMLCLLLSACTAGGSTTPKTSEVNGTPTTKEANQTNENVKIRILTLQDWGESKFKPMLDEYKKIKPNVSFQFETYPFQEMLKVIQVKMAAGDTNYDIISVDGPLNQNYASRGFLKPMDQYLSEADKKALVPSSLQAMTYNGKIYSAPMATASSVLYYNKDLFDKAGMPYPSSEKEARMTWEQVSELSQKLMEKLNPKRDNGIWAMALEQINATYNIMPLVNSLGGTGVGKDGITVDGVINSEPWVKAMTFYGNLFNKWNVSPKGMDPDQIRNLFVSGKLAMLVGAVEFAKNQIEMNNPKMNYGFAPHPYFKDGKAVTPTGSWHYGINTASKHPDEAMDFIHWAVWGAGSDISLAKVYPNLPARYDQIQKIIDDKSGEYVGFRAHYKLGVDEAMNTAVPRPLAIGYSDWDSVMMTVFEDIRNGAVPKQSLDRAVEELKPAMEKYRK
jgi:ABC-type glycerol-3-phosphate transport system substrate-binding protein